MTARQSFSIGQVFTAAQANALAEATVAVNAQGTATSYTLALTDAGKLITFTGDAATVTIPTNASVALAVGDQINIAQLGTAQITIGTAGGVSLVSAGSKTKTNGQYAVVTVVQYTANSWLLLGNTAS
jgi:flagellar basal body rod protein FlgF